MCSPLFSKLTHLDIHAFFFLICLSHRTQQLSISYCPAAAMRVLFLILWKMGSAFVGETDWAQKETEDSHTFLNKVSV